MDSVRYFRTFGFVVLRSFFDPAPLQAELDREVHDGTLTAAKLSLGANTRFQYVPMMTAGTPASLNLLDHAATVASELLNDRVIPTRAKGVRYWGNTPWHRDSDSVLESLGVAAYLEPLDASNGALRVVPGSHSGELHQALQAAGVTGLPAEELPAHVLATNPGDLILFDEHLFHASTGGGIRRQWRLDFLRDPTTPEEETRTRSYYSALYRPDWDGGYDVDHYPNYGPDWQNSGRPSVARLRELGVYELAAAQEAFSRSRRGERARLQN